MGNLIFITGGARSGKSCFAEETIKGYDGKTCYIATAIPFDEGMRARIEKHRESRPKEWETIERYKDFSALENQKTFTEADNILFDCLAVMVTNQLLDKDLDWEKIDTDLIDKAEAEIDRDVEKLLELLKEKNTVIVSNEVGLGIVPANYFSSYFRDILGRLNQKIAERADKVYVAVSGIPLQIK